jgi:hypothetical protein
LLDDRFVDPLVGMLLPGVGDVVTTCVGLYIVVVAVRKGLPAVVVARMLLNLAVDLGIGAVPVVGDVSDFLFRANSRNAKLLVERKPGTSSRRDWLVVIGASVLFALALTIPIVLLALAIRAIIGSGP